MNFVPEECAIQLFFFGQDKTYMCVWIKTGLVKPQMGTACLIVGETRICKIGGSYEKRFRVIRGYLNDFDWFWMYLRHTQKGYHAFIYSNCPVWTSMTYPYLWGPRSRLACYGLDIITPYTQRISEVWSCRKSIQICPLKSVYVNFDPENDDQPFIIS